MGSTEDFSFPCVAENEDFEPTPDELDLMYRKLDNGEMIGLTWKCPGRRFPTPVQSADTEAKKNTNTEQTAKNVEFDFMDEVASPTVRVQRPVVTAKSTAKKKTANFASVLDAMKKNKRNL